MFKLVDVDIDGMMSRGKYIVILGLVCLCLFVAPAMAETKACSKCTPQMKPAFGTSCPLACLFELGADFWANTAGDQFIEAGFLNIDTVLPEIRAKLAEQDEDVLLNTIDLPTGSKFTDGKFAVPNLNTLVSQFGKHVDDDMKSEYGHPVHIGFPLPPLPVVMVSY
jgi:hypothetical protein